MLKTPGLTGCRLLPEVCLLAWESLERPGGAAKGGAWLEASLNTSQGPSGWAGHVSRRLRVWLIVGGAHVGGRG